MVTGKQPEESPPVDDVPGMAAAGLQLHQAVLSEPGIEVECAPYQQRGRQDTECDAGPLSRSGHVHDYENHEYGEQSARKDKQVHALQAFELRTAADPLVDRILRHITGRMSVRWSLPQSRKYTPRTSWPPSSRCRGRRTRILNRP